MKGDRMDAAERKKFVANYTKLLTAAWTEDGLAARLKSDPKSVLTEFNFDIPADAKIEIKSSSDGDGNLDHAIQIWEEGASTGVYKLYVTEEPQYDAGELSESDLESVVGGASVSACCCCSPCCTCT